MEGADHQNVVQLIRQSVNAVDLVVISVSEEEARRLEPEGGGGMSAMDYYERRSVPISVPDSNKQKDDAGKEYVVYNIYLASRHTASRRYREFDALHANVSVLAVYPLSISSQYSLSVYPLSISAQYIFSVYPLSKSSQYILSVYPLSISSQYSLSV